MVIEIIEGKAYKVVDGKCGNCCHHAGDVGPCMSAKLCSRVDHAICYKELDEADRAEILAVVATSKGGET